MAESLDIKRVLLCDNVDSCCKDILEASGITVDVKSKMAKDELLAEIQNYDGLVVRSATKVTEDVLKAGKRLKIVGRAGTGVDNIDSSAAAMNGVLVMNTPMGNTLSAAEHTCALICCLSRHVAQSASSVKEGKWDRKKYLGNELFGKTLGIIGLGRIGREVASRMQSFGMKTIGYDPLVSAQEASEFNTEWMEPSQIWPRADYITVHVPLIPPTKGMLNDKTIAECKKGVYLLNVARGGIIDEEALLRALESGHCGGAGLDVYVTEPPTGQSLKLAQHPRVVGTPHLGANTVEAQKRVAKEIAEQIVDATKGKKLTGIVNVPFDLCEALKPSSLVSLGEGMGKIAGVLAGGDVTKVTVTTQGPELKSHRYLSAAVCMGVLSKPGLNLVNAMALTKAAGIEVKTSHENNPTSPYSRILSVKIHGKNGEATIMGSTIGENIPILFKYNDLSFTNPVPLVKKLLLISCKSNATDVLAKVFTKFGSKDIQGFVSASNDQETIYILSTCSDINPNIGSDIDGVMIFNQVSF